MLRSLASGPTLNLFVVKQELHTGVLTEKGWYGIIYATTFNHNHADVVMVFFAKRINKMQN